MAWGGGILNSGTLTVSNCSLTINKAGGGTGGYVLAGGEPVAGNGGNGFGGAIYNFGILSLTSCALVGNNAVGGPGGNEGTINNLRGVGGASCGGAIANEGTLAVTNCTIALNTSTGGNGGVGTGGNGGSAAGGAIWSGTNTVTLVNCTIYDNSANGGMSNFQQDYSNFGGDASGGGVFIQSGVFNSRNSLFAKDSATGGTGYAYQNFGPGGSGASYGPEVAGSFTSQGHNLVVETNGSTCWAASDLTGSLAIPLNAEVGSLQYAGGETETVPLLATSPAIDAGDDAVLSAPFNLTTDQRGMHRPNGVHVDIGAFEFGGTELVSSLADSGNGTLRQAIASASDGERITFAPLVTGTIALTSGELLITKQLSIIGPGATNLTISGSKTNRVLHVGSAGTLNLYSITVANGSVIGTAGATNATGSDAGGGGLYVEGNASLTDCVVASNTATGGTGGPGYNGYDTTGATGGNGHGGGIYNLNQLSLLRCTLAGNLTFGGTGGVGGSPLQGEPGGTGGVASGGALANAGTATLINCTFAGNGTTGGTGGHGGANQEGGTSGEGGVGGSAHGGGINVVSGSLTMASCTVSSNFSLPGSGGGFSGFGGGTYGPGSANCGGLFIAGTVPIQNCLIAGNQATNYPDVGGTVQSGGFNLVGIADGSTGWLAAEAGNLGNSSHPVNPRLGSLQSNGGATPTMALLSGSPAIDQGNSFGLTTDQRGFVRPFDNSLIVNASGGDGSDIGAYEVSYAPILLSMASYGKNQFQFLLTGQPGSNYVIQASTNVTTPVWISIFTNISPFTFVDGNPNNSPRRFYRGVSSP